MLRQPVRKAPLFARLVMGKMGGSIRGSTSLSSDGSQPESCSGYLEPRDGSTSSIYRLVTHRSASKKEIRQLLSCPLSQTLHNTCENMQKYVQKEFEKNSNRARIIQPRKVRIAAAFLDAKAVNPENFHINRLLTGSRLL
jgi:hypothetical protein